MKRLPLTKVVRRRLLFAVFMMLISGCATTAVPLATAWALNDGLLATTVDARALLMGTLLAVFFWFIFSFAEGVKSLLAAQAGAELATDLREKIYRARSITRLSDLRREDDSTRASRIMHDASEISGVPSLILNGALASAISGISAIIAMLVLDYRLAFIALLLTIPASLILRGISDKVSQRTVGYFDAVHVVNSHIADHLSLDSTVLSRILGRESWVNRQFAVASRRLAQSQVQRQSAGLWPMTTMNALLLCGPVLLYLTVGIMAPSWIAGIGAGTIVAFTSLQVRLPYGVSGTFTAVTQFRGVRTLLRRIATDLDKPVDRDLSPAYRTYYLDDSNDISALSLSACRFFYADGMPILNGVNLSVSRGEWVTLTGESGVGKSTFLRVVAGLEDLQSGTIRVNLRPLPDSDARPAIDLLPQKPYFFASSIIDNMRFAAPDASEEEVWSALEAVCLDQVVRDLPLGFDTPIGVGGNSLSGGQLQRLALARAVLRDASVILLDEATSALDVATERRIWESLAERWIHRTVVTVTHRPAEVPAARTIMLNGATVA